MERYLDSPVSSKGNCQVVQECHHLGLEEEVVEALRNKQENMEREKKCWNS